MRAKGNMPPSEKLDKKAAVIGSGFGGLGAAIRLQSTGIQTVLYEARDLPGDGHMCTTMMVSHLTLDQP